MENKSRNIIKSKDEKINKTATELPIEQTEQDKRLAHKYPVIYKRIFAALKELSSNNTGGVPVDMIGEKINHIARPAAIEEILDNVSWAATVGDNYIYSAEVVDKNISADDVTAEPINNVDTIQTEDTSANTAAQIETVSATGTEIEPPENAPTVDENEILTIDFNGEFDLTYTKPERFIYFGEDKPCGTSWKSLYISFIATVLDDYPRVFSAGMIFGKGGIRVDLAIKNDCAFMAVPKQIPDTDYMLETNLSADNIVRKIRYVLELCNVDFENVVIIYKKKARSQRRESGNILRLSLNKQLLAHSTLKNEIIESVKAVLKQNYAYGIKYDSIREMVRFHRYAESMGVTVPENDEELKEYILSVCTVIDGKAYCKNDNMPQELQHIVDSIFSSGANVVYYESLYENEQEWMEANVITSSEMLKKYLQDSIQGCYFARKFMVNGEKHTEQKAVTDELKRVWGEHQVESIYNLSKMLPYIPMDNIMRVIISSDIIISASERKFLLIDRFQITENEKQDILTFVEQKCDKNDSVSIRDIPLGNIEEENYELTQSVIYNAIYKKILVDKYHLNGKILTKGTSEQDVDVLLEQYTKDKEECTFNEIVDKVIELTGNKNRKCTFRALYSNMVRVDKNRFVNDRCVDFSVDEIDNALSGFITDDFIAIREVTTFAMFPLCGQSWNHYLLESFCYKYSREYSLHVINFNDKNAGIIAKNGFNKKYDEMLAIALARGNTKLSSETAGKYLCDVGYLAKSKYSKLDEIVQRVIEIRKG